MQINLEKLDSFLPLVKKPARYTGGELNSIVKQWDEQSLKIVFAFPDIYEIAMANVALQIIYGLLNDQENVICERVFSPWIDMEEQLRKNEVPLYSLETKHPLTDFDAIAISLGYELSYTNILNMLDLAGIPLERKNRTINDPLIFAGGHAAFNPRPLEDFVDFFIIGEVEEVILELTKLLSKKKKPFNKEEIFLELAKIEGIYVPSLKNKVKRRIIKNLNNAFYPLRPIVPFIAPVHDRANIEIMRGCARRCYFCQAGYVSFPKRERSIDVLLKQVEAIIASTGYEELSLLSLSSCDYSHIEELMERLDDFCGKHRISISLPSSRMDSLKQGVIDIIQKHKANTITLAPEAGTQRLRDYINKNITEEDIFKAIEVAKKSKIKSAKLYFMIGLPSETQEDIQGIIDLAFKLRTFLPITVSISNFIPKPHTPFQRTRQIGPEEIAQKQAFLKNKIRGRNLKLRWHNANLSLLEGILSRGGQDLGIIIKKAWEAGCRFDAWEETFQWQIWEKVLLDFLSEMNLENKLDYFLRERLEGEQLPWDIIDAG